MLLNSLFLFAVSILRLGDSWRFNEVNYRNLDEREPLMMNDLEYEMHPRELELYLDHYEEIRPSTVWCGRGDSAKDYNDLGTDEGTDRCCRAHDHCEDVIKAGGSGYNLTNTSTYTKLHCDCDMLFRVCLRRDKTDMSTTVGIFYFNILGTQCFRKDYNATGCLKYGGFLHTKCLKYKYDIKSKKFYQWFDVPNYYT